MKKFIFVCAVALGVLVATGADAAEVRFPGEGGGNVVVRAEERLDSLYTAGGSVNIHGSIAEDLFIGGGSVVMTGTVGEDLFVTGGNITIGGTVGGDVRTAGGNVTITAPVGGDILAGGGTVSVSGEAGVGGDVWVAGGSVVISAPVRGSVRIAGGEVRIDAPIAGTIDITAEKLTFGPGARATSTVTYRGSEPAVVEEGAVVGSINFEEYVPERRGAWAFLTFGFLVQILAMLVAAGALYLFFRGWLTHAVEEMATSPWRSLLTGLVGIIVLPIAIVLLFITVAGYYAAIILLLLFILTILTAGILAAIFAGSQVVAWIRQKDSVEVTWISIVVGVVALPFISLVPIIGWIICAGLFLMAFGALLQKGYRIGARQHARK